MIKVIGQDVTEDMPLNLRRKLEKFAAQEVKNQEAARRAARLEQEGRELELVATARDNPGRVYLLAEVDGGVAKQMVDEVRFGGREPYHGNGRWWAESLKVKDRSKIFIMYIGEEGVLMPYRKEDYSG